MEDIHITLTDEQAEWVRNNDSFNLSGFVREELQKEIDRRS